MTDITHLSFGRCEVDLTCREVWLDGKARPLEPRPFDLLAHLLRNRDRVVTKQELLHRIWPRDSVSPSALARAIMKVRQAIGDDGDDPLIRTVSRVGYCFVAPVDMRTPIRARNGDPPGGKATQATIALLPIDNATGDPSLGWVRLGLASVVADRLAGDGRLLPVALQPVLAALEGARASSAENVELAVLQATGASFVVRSRLSRAEAGYHLQLSLFGHTVRMPSALSAKHPVEFASGMATALQGMLFPDDTEAGSAPRMARHEDPWVTYMFACGLQAAGEQKWAEAAGFHQKVIDKAPEHLGAHLELLRSMASLGRLAARRLAHRLLARAERDHDLMLAAHVHQLQGLLYLNRAALVPAGFHLEKAIRLANGRETPDWLAQTLLLKGSAAAQQRQPDSARQALDRMQRLCDRSGNRIFPLTGLNMLAIMASAGGELESALDTAMEAVRRARGLPTPRHLADACAIATYCLILLNRLPEAAALAKEGFATALCLGDAQFAANTARVVSWFYRLTNKPEALDQVVAALPEPERLDQPDGVWTARAHQAASRRRYAEAAQCFQRAIDTQPEAASTPLEQTARSWLVDTLVMCGRLDSAESALAGLTHSLPLNGPALHGQALLAHARGDVAGALAWLDRMQPLQTAPLWEAWACIDAAWLLSEAGDPLEAAARLARLHGAAARTPHAWAARARMCHALGDFDSAHQAHLHYLESIETPSPDDFFLQLGPLYASLASGTSPAAAPLPLAPRLPSRL